jgi:hypothetical protein
MAAAAEANPNYFQSRRKTSPCPLLAGEGKAVRTKCHMNRGEVVFEIKLAIALIGNLQQITIYRLLALAINPPLPARLLPSVVFSAWVVRP